MAKYKKDTLELYKKLVREDGFKFAPHLPNPIKDTGKGYHEMGVVGKGKLHITKIDSKHIDKLPIDVVWCFHDKVVKGVRYSGYVVSRKGPLHRVLTDCPKGKVIDHINHDTLDNRSNNLRITTPGGNMLNKSIYRANKTGHTNIINFGEGKYRLNIIRIFYDKKLVVECNEKINEILKKYSTIDAEQRKI